MQDIEGWNEDAVEEVGDDVGADETNENGDDDEDEDVARVEPNIPHSEAINHVNGLINWCTQNKENSTRFMDKLIELRTHIVTTQMKKSEKQTTLTDYFKSNAN